MGAGPGDVRVQAGVCALDGAQWGAALEFFEQALELADTPEAHDGRGQALWFLGRIPESVADRERAFEGYVAAGRCDDAARAAVWVSHQHLLAGRTSAARGWLARAERCLERAGASCPGRGWLAVERSRQAGSAADQYELAETALGIARVWAIPDLEVLAMSLVGRAVVSAGRHEEGLRLLEEAMAAASSGQVRSVHTLAEAYCNLIEGCAIAGDWERGAEWCELVEDFARTHETAPLLGACRTIHADVLLQTGRWPEAEHALEVALVVHARFIPQMSAPAVAALAELRVQQGRLAEAGHLLAGRDEEPASLRSLALLRLADGHPAEAAALLERGLRATGDHAVRAAVLLAALVEARLECGEADAAARAGDQLSKLGNTTGIRLVQAHADLARARVALATGRDPDAAEPGRRALQAFRRLAMPFGVGQARLCLARALAAEAPEIARDEARLALGVFRELGATRAADAAAALLRELGVATAARSRVPGQLTAREQEVLELVALGMSNARIASTLVISEKTAGHHVSRILAKLGVSNRTEAAARSRGTTV